MDDDDTAVERNVLGSPDDKWTCRCSGFALLLPEFVNPPHEVKTGPQRQHSALSSRPIRTLTSRVRQATVRLARIVPGARDRSAQ